MVSILIKNKEELVDIQYMYIDTYKKDSIYTVIGYDFYQGSYNLCKFSSKEGAFNFMKVCGLSDFIIIDTSKEIDKMVDYITGNRKDVIQE